MLSEDFRALLYILRIWGNVGVAQKA